MYRHIDSLLFSASDLANFLDCEHLTTLDRRNVDEPLPRAPDDDSAKLVQAKGFAHEERYLAQARTVHATFVNIAEAESTLDGRVGRTLSAMHMGVDLIYQAAFRDQSLIGHADFLRRVSRPSSMGDFGYEVVDTKLARTPRARFLVQTTHYSHLLAKAQGVEPVLMHVVLGDGTERSFRYADYVRYYRALLQRFLRHVDTGAVSTYPEPCAHCDLCHWREVCKATWAQDDHLSLVAGISRVQTTKLMTAGIPTLRALAELPATFAIPKMAPATLDRIRNQARLQLLARESGERQVELLPERLDESRGFRRLPRPDDGDLFFDMEGDPFEEGGLEYLFGLYYMDGGRPVFRPLWAHSRREERVAFEEFMDFVTAHLRRFPGAHIYHYAAYEEAALKKLMSLHGTREAEVDNLLRLGKLVDLYRVVREGIRISEPKYSLKNVEHFYLERRSGAVTDAGSSVVYYDRWKASGDPTLLQAIEEYNRDDVRSTYELREWLLRLRPAEFPWAHQEAIKSTGGDNPDVGTLTEAELRLVPYRQALVDVLPGDRAQWTADAHFRELTYQLLDFHRRAAKPAWWAMFARQEMTDEELLDDIECLGELTLDPDCPPHPEQRSIVYTYRFPEQETKLKSGDRCVQVANMRPLGGLHIDEESRQARVRVAANREPLPARISIGPAGPIATTALTNALFRFADSVVADTHAYPAIEAVLRHEIPRIDSVAKGAAIIDEANPLLPQAIEAVTHLEQSYIFLQGPPGAGKTYTGSHLIVELLRRGRRVGVSSNSHKAINNLLAAVETQAHALGFEFRGAKKSTKGDADNAFDGSMVADVFTNDDAFADNYQLLAGTAWLFADPAADQILDYLFIDEAGQVALANLVAMAASARNLVLLGDQMQLGQPIQGTHPGRSGESSLEFLLGEHATVSPDRGIFLATTWRMHPDVCRFISDAVYDGRLQAEPENGVQGLVLQAGSHPALRPTGVRFLPVEHQDCSQRSQEEADVVLALVESLLGQSFRDKRGALHPVTLQDILVVAPFNMQVNLLRQVLPAGARVGTVDKFQGQEAEVVIVSMATSNGDYLPRHIEFLYSRNRLNVSISRARCLAVLVASPALLAIRCSTPEQMSLVNTLCWVREASEVP